MVRFKTVLKDLVKTAKDEIKKLASSKLNNAEKKEKLDSKIKIFIEKVICGIKTNPILKIILKRLVLPYVSDITQVIYDLIKIKINGVTKEEE